MTVDKVSRRQLLGMTAAIGSFALCNRSVFGATGHIEQFDPVLENIISATEPIRQVASVLSGKDGPLEGPLWWKEGGYLLFSDISNNRRMKYVPGRGVSVDFAPTNHANGLTRDLQGRLIACERETQRVTRREADGSITVVAGSFQGRRLLRPNDVIVKSDGSIYFSDLSSVAPEAWEVVSNAVYRVSPDLGTVSLLTDDLVAANGLALSPDEKLLYIIDARARNIHVFEFLESGLLAKNTGRVFAEFDGSEPGAPDGMKVDSAGNVYCGGPGGLYILDSSGKKLGRIAHGQPNTVNMAFGGADWKTLYFTTWTDLFSVDLKVSGTPVPPRKP